MFLQKGEVFKEKNITSIIQEPQNPKLLPGFCQRQRGLGKNHLSSLQDLDLLLTNKMGL